MFMPSPKMISIIQRTELTADEGTTDLGPLFFFSAIYTDIR